jgi:hypothetical protein
MYCQARYAEESTPDVVVIPVPTTWFKVAFTHEAPAELQSWSVPVVGRAVSVMETDEASLS